MSLILGGLSQESKDIARTEKLVEKNLKEVNKALATMKKHYNRLRTPRITANMGFVSPKIYLNNPKQQSCALFEMPAEIQNMIWSNLSHQPDRVAFALTCKWNAQQHEELKKTYKKKSIKTIRKEHRLAVLMRLDPWMPQKYRLCFTCARYLPRKSGEFWGGDSKLLETEIVKGHVARGVAMRGPKCPDCKYRAEVDMLDHVQTIREFKNVLKNQFGSLDG